MLEIAIRLFSDWNQNNIRYCHWKSNEHLEEGLEGLTDLDVLVSPDNKMNCESILRDLNFIKCQPQYGSRYPDVDDWLGYDPSTGQLIHIHLHYHIITGHLGMKEYNLSWTQEALDTRILDEYTGMYIMEPNLEIMTLYTRIALKATLKKLFAARKGKFALDQGSLKEIAFLKQRINLKLLGGLVNKYFGSEKLVRDFMIKGFLSSEDFLALHRYVSKRMKPYRVPNLFLSLVQKNYYNVVLPTRRVLQNKVNRLIINKKTPQSGGMMVAFIGQDGSGKSTVTHDIVNWLSWKLEAHKFYLGSGEHYFSWQKNLKKRMENQKKYRLVAILSAWLTLSNYITIAKRTYKSIKKGRHYTLNGGIAIFDRYPQTVYYGINDGPKIRVNYLDRISNPLLKHIVLHCAKVEEKYLMKAERIAPHLVFKLMLPPEISIVRKPEENYENVQRKHDIVKSLSFRQSDVYAIDVTKEYREEIKEIKGFIWDTMLKQKSSNSME